jgi:catechol 2,3-dioxygenase-like lactoylglutathione lyase family enzyme
LKVIRIDHLGIAVPSLDVALAAYRALGFEVESVHDVDHREGARGVPARWASRASSCSSPPTPAP